MRNQLLSLFQRYPEVKLAYFFGSRVRGEEGPLSDYDIALYINESDSTKLNHLYVTIIPEITRCLNTDDVDVVLLNTVQQPELAYTIITTGELLYEQEPFRILIEPRILNTYFDFYTLLKQHHLTNV
ncbi:nucleotidyltransferase domain-containing protein [Candidatus Uhrbacteria bacterium]|nr:nucleotidyltransferase domain-containing protein [Candidatus Uhrbacteria bacterium]